MRRIASTLATVMFSGLTLVPNLLDAEPQGLPESASPLMNAALYGRLRLSGGQTDDAAFTIGEGAGPSGSPQKILRLTTLETPAPAYILRVSATTNSDIKKGDTIWTHFFMRTDHSPKESGEGTVEFVFEERENYEKSGKITATAVGEWREFALAFTAKGNYPAGEADMILRIGLQKQVVELAGFEVLNFGAQVDRKDLPKLGQEVHYAGSEPTAPWRKAAAARIEEIRKATLTIRVTDAQGQPLAGAKVRVRQTSHEYGFGSAVSAKLLADDASSGNAEQYQEAVRRCFNIVTMENDFKWRQWREDSATPLAATQWCHDAGLRVRGHTLVWPGWRKLPPHVKALEGDPAALRQEVLGHIEDEGAKAGDNIAIWDVMNEPYTNHDLMDILGKSAMVDWFKAAKAAAPHSRLFINDYGIINGRDQRHPEHYAQTIEYLQAQGAPLEGIGIQGHFGTAPSDIEEILAGLDRFGKYGLPLEMTEFSLEIEDPEVAANYLRDVMTVFFSHPATDAFLIWTFNEGTGFDHTAKLYDRQWRLTPAGETWLDLISKQWHTETEVTTAADGTAALRGFKGNYVVELDGAASQTVALGSQGAEAKLILLK